MTSTRPARSRRKRNLSPPLLLSALLAAAVITSPAEGSLPRAGLQEANPAALAGAKAVESGRLLAAGLETPFTLITADELEGVLACDPVPEAGGLNLGEDPSLEPPQLTSRACAASFSLHLEPVDFELNPQRGPPLEIPDLHQGWFVADSKTRIGGFRLELEDLIGGERSLTLELHWGYEVGRVGLTEDEPPDPWGLVGDTVVDAALIGTDIYFLMKDYKDPLNWAALGVDAACLFIPLATGCGPMLRGGEAAVSVGGHVAARVVSKAEMEALAYGSRRGAQVLLKGNQLQMAASHAGESPDASGASPAPSAEPSSSAPNPPIDQRISRERYRELRKQTPSQAIRDQVNPPGEKVDPVYGTSESTLEADHIIAMKRLTEDARFAQLTNEQQRELLNLADNFWGLGKRSNTSRGAKDLESWPGHSKLGPVPSHVRVQMAELKDKARVAIEAFYRSRLKE